MPDDNGFSIESHCIAKCFIESCFYKMFLPGLINATDVANSVNILVAIRWAVVKAWVAVKETTICKSFEKLVYSGTSEKGTLWDQYKFKWFVPFIEVVLF